MTGYRHCDVADGIAGALAGGGSAFIDVDDVSGRTYGPDGASFTVTADSLQRFRVTVEELTDSE